MGGGPPRFRQGFSCPALLEKTRIRSASFSRTRLSRSLARHSSDSANHANFLPYPVSVSCWSQTRYLETSSSSLAWSRVISQPLICIRLTTYLPGKNCQTKACKVWAYPVSLATTPRIVIYFLFLRPTKMFQFSRFPFNVPMYSVRDNMTLLMLGFPIRNSPDHSLLTATRSLSQSSTSFIGDIRLGIHYSALEYLFMH